MAALLLQRKVRLVFFATLAAVWLAVTIGGMVVMANHSMTAGRRLTASLYWPPESRISRPVGSACLLMFVHPDCPCTRASLGELEKLLTRHGDHVHARIVAYCHTDAASNQSSHEFYGVTTTLDSAGTEAKCFHVATSGQVLLYDADGKLQFSGGITSARGHAGDSDGAEAIDAILRSETPAVRRTPVYGCSIAGRSSAEILTP
ncbi:MAG: RedB protein [Pirellula sp.]|nr:RedB protein [Pirellula sp.]